MKFHVVLLNNGFCVHSFVFDWGYFRPLKAKDFIFAVLFVPLWNLVVLSVLMLLLYWYLMWIDYAFQCDDFLNGD